MKIRPVGAELLEKDGRTDGWAERHDKAKGRFSQKATKTGKCET
jgi:hypothetical protein